MPLFDTITYHLSETLTPSTHARVASLLSLNGATPSSVDEATHIVSNSAQFEGWEKAKGVVATVEWVIRSMVLGKLQPPQFYSADPAMLFSGVVACSTELTGPDTETLAAGITALGGQFRTGLTHDVTHLFALATSSQKYETAIHYKNDTGMKVVLPHWFDDVVKLGVRALGGEGEGGGLDTKPYEWPNPAILCGPLDDPPPPTPSASKNAISGEKRALFKSVLEETKSPAETPARDVWGGRRILLSATLGLSSGRREAVEAGIWRAGGDVVRAHGAGSPTKPNRVEGNGQQEAEGEEDALDRADVFVTRWRDGRAYRKAMKSGKTVASLPWIFFVASLHPSSSDNSEEGGGLAAPTEQLLHFPLPLGDAKGFEGHKITLTNYTGEAREYLKRLITVLGAEFTANMSAGNTVVVAAYLGGLKTQKALSWSIPVVNHTWLEDCFLQWRALSPACSPRYVAFPKGVDFVGVLGGRGVGKAVFEELDTEDDAMDRDDGELRKDKNQRGDAGEPSEPVGTGASVLEVEDAVGFGDEDSPSPKKMLATKEKALPKPTRTNSLVKITPSHPLIPYKSPAGKKQRATAVEEDDDGMDVDAEPKLKSASKRRKSAVWDEDHGAQAGPSLVRPNSKYSPNKYKSKTKSAEKNKRIALDEEEDDDEMVLDSPSKSNLKPKPQPQPKPKFKEGAKSWQEEQDNVSGYEGFSDDEREVIVIGGGSARSRAKEQARRKAVEEAVEDDDDEEEEEEAPPKRKYKEGKSRQAEMNRESSWEESAFEGGERGVLARSGSSKKAGLSARAKSKKKAKEFEEEEEEEEEEVQLVSKRGKKKAPPLPKPFDEDSGEDSAVHTKATRAKGKRAVQVESSEEEEPVPAPAPKSKAKPKPPKPKSSKKPPPPESTSESEVHIVASKLKGKAPAKHDTTTDGEDDPPPAPKAKGKATNREVNTPRRVVSVVLPTSSSGKKLIPRTESLRAEAAEVASGSGSPKGIQSPRESLGKRSAAVRATDRLHNVIAPDMNNFAQEKKRGFKSRRGEWEEGTSVSSVKGIKDEGKKRRGSEGKRKATESGEDESDTEIRPVKPAKKARVATGDEDESDGVSVAKKAKTVGIKHGTSETDPGTVKLMTTQVTLSEDVQKALTKMGVRFTTKPTECTHLIVPQVVRTEKFLCAMSVAPFILKESWALESAAAKHILPEEQYMLQDHVNEKKFNFTLSEALRRAKANSAGVFDKLTFYVTPKVPVDIKLLKAVVTAGGGQVLTQTPTLRILKANENRHVVSCPADASTWRPLLANGYVIYSPELLLTGALKQKIDWKEGANMVPDS